MFYKGNLLYSEFDRIFHDLFKRRSEASKDILLTLIKNLVQRSEDVFEFLNMKKSGVFSDYIAGFDLGGINQRNLFAWNISDGKI